MATTNGNGNGNGDGNGQGGGLTRSKLLTILAHHERIAMAIRTTLQVLEDESALRKTKTATSMIAKAITMDLGRRRKKKPTKPHAERIAERRKFTEKFLAKFDTTEPRMVEGLKQGGAGTLVRHGYLKAKGDGYIRTAKEFTP